MPFTISHAVVAPALARLGLPIAAVAAGAMAPDLPLFVRDLDYDTMHSPVTALGTSLPVAVVFFCIWRLLLLPALPRLLPRSVSMRLADAAPHTSGVRSAALVVLACSVGVATHLVWDSFTHRSGAAVVALPALVLQAGPFPVFAWLQYGSSVGGLLGLAFLAVRWYRSRRPSGPEVGAPTVAWVSAIIVCAGTGLAAGAMGVLLSVGAPAAVVGGVTASTSAAALIVVGAAVVVRLRGRGGRRGSRRGGRDLPGG